MFSSLAFRSLCLVCSQWWGYTSTGSNNQYQHHVYHDSTIRQYDKGAVIFTLVRLLVFGQRFLGHSHWVARFYFAEALGWMSRDSCVMERDRQAGRLVSSEGSPYGSRDHPNRSAHHHSVPISGLWLSFLWAPQSTRSSTHRICSLVSCWTPRHREWMRPSQLPR